MVVHGVGRRAGGWADCSVGADEYVCRGDAVDDAGEVSVEAGFSGAVVVFGDVERLKVEAAKGGIPDRVNGDALAEACLGDGSELADEGELDFGGWERHFSEGNAGTTAGWSEDFGKVWSNGDDRLTDR